MPLIPTTDICTLALEETVTIVATEHVALWGGGARLEPAMFLAPTSTRMETLPPDQSRSGTW